MGKRETQFFATAHTLGLRIDLKPKFNWLTNTILRSEQEESHDQLTRIFHALGGDLSGMQDKRKVCLEPDAYLPDYHCILEFDELQHFTREREKTLLLYQNTIDLGYDLPAYIELCAENYWLAHAEKRKGFSKPVKEFPFEGGRRCQRALFDTMRDVLSPENGLRPTMRISCFEVPSIRSEGGGGAEEMAFEVRIALNKRGVRLAS